MKKSLRFASAALAVALAASCAAPAFAAGGSSFTKSETVYAVMNADAAGSGAVSFRYQDEPRSGGRSAPDAELCMAAARH